MQPRFLSVAGAALAVCAVMTAILAAFGTRSGWWDFRAGFELLKGAAYGGLSAAVLSLIGLLLTVVAKPLGTQWLTWWASVAGLLLGLAVVAVPWQFKHTAQRVPSIHDITTDPEKPPVFVALLAARRYAPNGSAYGGPDIAAQQRTAYPDLVPLTLSMTAHQAFQIALLAAQHMGWTIVDSNVREGRIEATDTTFWFGFKDDVVVRVKPAGPGAARIDVRSVSRVGKSDIGTNAKRIRRYLEAVARRVGSSASTPPHG